MSQVLMTLQVCECFASTQNVPAPDACCAVQVLSQLQVWPSVALLHDWCVGQVELLTGSENGQPVCASVWQSDCVVPFVQKLPEPVQPAGATLGSHWQEWTVPEPVQTWCPPQAAAVAVTQPCASATQVVSVFAPPVQNEPATPPVQSVGAALQEQAAAPTAPPQVSFAVQVVVVPESKRQAPSAEQVWTLPPLHIGPATVHAVVLHAQRWVVASQVECALHAVTVLTGQLFASSEQWTDVVPLLQMSLGVVLLPVLQPFGSALHVQAAAPGAPVHVWFAAQATGAAA